MSKMVKRTASARRKLLAAALLGAAMLASTSAQAQAVRWTVLNGTFDDATVFTGSFDYDATTDTYGDFDFMTFDGTLTGAQYTPSNSQFQGNSPTSFGVFNFTRFQSLSFTLRMPLTNAGGTIPIDTAASGEQSRFGGYRAVSGGSVSAPAGGPGAPGPLAGVGFLPAIAAFGALVATRVRRRKVTFS